MEKPAEVRVEISFSPGLENGPRHSHDLLTEIEATLKSVIDYRFTPDLDILTERFVRARTEISDRYLRDLYRLRAEFRHNVEKDLVPIAGAIISRLQAEIEQAESEDAKRKLTAILDMVRRSVDEIIDARTEYEFRREERQLRLAPEIPTEIMHWAQLTGHYVNLFLTSHAGGTLEGVVIGRVVSAVAAWLSKHTEDKEAKDVEVRLYGPDGKLVDKKKLKKK